MLQNAVSDGQNQYINLSDYLKRRTYSIDKKRLVSQMYVSFEDHHRRENIDTRMKDAFYHVQGVSNGY